jgi:putative copper export protein
VPAASGLAPWLRLRAFGLAAGAALLVAAALRLLAQSVAMHGGAAAFDGGLVWAMLAHTLWGSAWLVQAAAALLAIVGFSVLPRRPAAGWTLAALAAVAAALGASLSGHAAAVPGRAALAVVADAAHVLAAGGWLGTLLVLSVVGLPMALREAPGERGRSAAALVNAFSPLALGCAAVLALTGALSAWLHLGGLDALLASAYGRTLLVKLAALVPVAAIGAWNWRRMRPRLTDDADARLLRRSTTVELAFGVLVLAVTAVLVATPPPMDGIG